MLDLWSLCRVPGGLGGAGHVNPGPGGAGDQPAALLDAFAMIDRALAPPPKGD